MRQRWAELSCRRTLLGRAPERFAARQAAWLAQYSEDEPFNTAEFALYRPPAFEAVQLDLKGVMLWVRIDDEQAKINLNEQLRSDPEAAFSPTAVVERLLAPDRSRGVVLTRPEFVNALDLEPLASWPQVMPGQDPQDLLGIHGPDNLVDELHGSTAANLLTLWGSGRLNLYTTRGDVLRQRLEGTVDPATIEDLIRFRDEEPGLGLEALIVNATAERADARQALQGVLTDRSDCYTMWLACRASSREDGAVKWSLSVLESSTNHSAADNVPIQGYRW